ncbi:hypothetical protein [Streptomyces sp. NK08204]|uniref:hypothetical protein n=1 Tax=Streptomyces sp. NK08204 TaxID=2873260 RepID=UPI001CED046A|nr:hypothetical protein [Streptomyces sp. NK08204]
MATESKCSTVQRDGDSLILGLLARLTPTGGGDFLPDLPGRKLLTLVSCYHRRPTRVGFPEPAAEWT